jgi:flagellar biosynthesis/type III secretory pathway chaperone
MQATILPQEIRSILEEQYNIAYKLRITLNQEYKQLSDNDLPGLEISLEAKQKMIDMLEAISRNFLAAVHQHFPDTKDAITKFLRHKDPENKFGLEAIWQQIEEQLSACRQKNSTNGKIIYLNHRQFQRALEILRTGCQSSETSYDLSGANHSSAPSRILGKV